MIRRRWAHVWPHDLAEGDIVADLGKVTERTVTWFRSVDSLRDDRLLEVEVGFLSGERKEYRYIARQDLDANPFTERTAYRCADEDRVFAFTEARERVG